MSVYGRHLRCHHLRWWVMYVVCCLQMSMNVISRHPVQTADAWTQTARTSVNVLLDTSPPFPAGLCRYGVAPHLQASSISIYRVSFAAYHSSSSMSHFVCIDDISNLSPVQPHCYVSEMASKCNGASSHTSVFQFKFDSTVGHAVLFAKHQHAHIQFSIVILGFDLLVTPNVVRLLLKHERWCSLSPKPMLNLACIADISKLSPVSQFKFDSTANHTVVDRNAAHVECWTMNRNAWMNLIGIQ